MKLRRLLLIALAALATGASQAREVARVPAPEGVLPVIITESVGTLGSAFTDYDRLDLALQKVAKERNWPVKIAAEKFAANIPDYLTEVQITLQRVREETPGEYMYRAWTTLLVDGKKHDFSIVTARLNYRAGEQYDRVMEKLFLHAAKTTADKIEPVLFPDLKKDKK